MKVLVLGCGGIGSWLVSGIFDVLDEEFKDYEFVLADGDIVESEQLTYQKFEIKEVGENKAVALCNMYPFEFIDHRITKVEELWEFGYIVCCVDNMATRKLVYDSGIPFLDLRAEGRMVYATQKTPNYLQTLNLEDKENGSCQTDKSKIDFGNRIVANIGVQMLLNKSRGQPDTGRSIAMRV